MRLRLLLLLPRLLLHQGLRALLSPWLRAATCVDIPVSTPSKPESCSSICEVGLLPHLQCWAGHPAGRTRCLCAAARPRWIPAGCAGRVFAGEWAAEGLGWRQRAGREPEARPGGSAAGACCCLRNR